MAFPRFQHICYSHKCSRWYDSTEVFWKTEKIHLCLNWWFLFYTSLCYLQFLLLNHHLLHCIEITQCWVKFMHQPPLLALVRYCLHCLILLFHNYTLSPGVRYHMQLPPFVNWVWTQGVCVRWRKDCTMEKVNISPWLLPHVCLLTPPVPDLMHPKLVQ